MSIDPVVLRRRAVWLVLLATLMMSAGAYAANAYPIDRSGGVKLYTMTGPVTVFAEPKRGSKMLHTYGAGAIMAVLGRAAGTHYLYVSPCNACTSGYVRDTEFMRRAKR